mgnify:CR=1 FL=1|jgi:hypothetical protein
MKVNIKALELIEKGLSSKTVGKLTESQIDVLHSKLVSEQVTEVPNKKTYKVGPEGGEVDGVVIKQDPNTKEVMVTTKEGEMSEDDDFDLDMDQSYTGQQGSHDEYQASDDGMDDDTSPENHDSKMIGMSEEKTDKPNPWAICHSQVGPKKSRKWERCVKAVKKQLGEGKNVVSLYLENEIMRIVERNLPPRITKGELVKYLTEADTETAPTRTKPTTKPGTRPSHPGKNPNPGVNPAPKAKRPSPEEAKDKIMDVIMQILEK